MECFVKKMLVLMMVLWLTAAVFWNCCGLHISGESVMLPDLKNKVTDEIQGLSEMLYESFRVIEDVAEVDFQQITRNIKYAARILCCVGLTFMATGVVMIIQLICLKGDIRIS